MCFHPLDDKRKMLNLRLFCRQRVAVWVAVLLIAGCDSPTAPSMNVNGEWDFTFSAFDQHACPANSAITRGCAGSGRLDFPSTTPINASHSYRASCQSCEGAGDYGAFEQPLQTLRLDRGMLEFTLAACRFTAPIPATSAQTIAGTVICTPLQAAGAEVSGNWNMSRR